MKHQYGQGRGGSYAYAYSYEHVAFEGTHYAYEASQSAQRQAHPGHPGHSRPWNATPGNGSAPLIATERSCGVPQSQAVDSNIWISHRTLPSSGLPQLCSERGSVGHFSNDQRTRDGQEAANAMAYMSPWSSQPSNNIMFPNCLPPNMNVWAQYDSCEQVIPGFTADIWSRSFVPTWSLPMQPKSDAKFQRTTSNEAAVPTKPHGANQGQVYETLHRVRLYRRCGNRVNKTCRTAPTRTYPLRHREVDAPEVLLPAAPQVRARDDKIMLPAPKPNIAYLRQASYRPDVCFPPDLKLVVLDLNGTLVFRPNPRREPKRMVGRPFLAHFLDYLFENFAVMIWSSARPPTVKSLVEGSLGVHQDELIAVWARDTLGLSQDHYNKNVQCYKDLERIWSSDQIQAPTFDGFMAMTMPMTMIGKPFDQRNTILIDDSALKASAQPHNLLLIPEFMGLAEEGAGKDVLGEVAGYLELLKMQADVSRFIHKTPFKADGTWTFRWEDYFPAGYQGHGNGHPL